MKKFPPIIEKFPHIIHGADYNPEQWIKDKDVIWDEDMRLLKLANMNSLSLGMFSWAMLEPEEGVFEFAWLDEILDKMNENGAVAVLSTPSASRPNWLAEKYPEVLRTDGKRVKRLYGDRHNHCLSSPLYREKVSIINKKLAQRYKDHPALGMWHISNEYSGECHCELCQEEFRSYIKNKYKTIDKVNDAWWSTFWSHRYNDFSQIESPSEIGETNTHGLNIDWLRFSTEQHVSFYLNEIKSLKGITPNIPCTANLMANYNGIDYFRLAEVLDVVSWDSYPEWTGVTEKDIEVAKVYAFNHDLMYGLQRKPFMLMESSPSATNWRKIAKLHRPGVHKLQSMQAVAHGSDSVQYFQFRKGRGASEKFHGAVVDHVGNENTRVFNEIKDLGEDLKNLDYIIGTYKPSKIALIYDYNVEWAINDVKGGLQKGNNYRQTIINHYGAFWRMGIPVDIIDQTKDIEKYDLVVAPMLYMLREGFSEKIEKFVSDGGTLVTSYYTGYVNETDLCFMGGFPGPLKDIIGIWAEEIDALYEDDKNGISWNNKEYTVYDLAEIIHVNTAEVLGKYTDDFYKDTPVLTKNNYKNGVSYHIAARTDDDFLDDFYEYVINNAKVIKPIEEKLPKGVNLQVRTDGEKNFGFILNFTNSVQKFNINEEDILMNPHGYKILEI